MLYDAAMLRFGKSPWFSGQPSWLPPLAIVLAGVALRAIFPHNASFGFDQVQIAQAADAIIHGDFTLIGPRTGPANMFTGPLIYYIAAPFSLVLPFHYAVVATATCIALLTGLTLWWLTQRYAKNLQTPILVVWAFSTLLIGLDRVPWNPNLSVVAASLVFFPLLQKDRKHNWVDVIAISSGVFLGYQAHFSGLLLLPLALIATLMFFRPKLVSAISILVGFGFSLLPTVLFDWRNDWLNLRGLLRLTSNDDQVNTYMALGRFIEKLRILLETQGRLVFNVPDVVAILLVGCTLLALYLLKQYQAEKDKSQLWVSIGWFLAIAGSYALYRESTPEYYFLIAVPVFLVVIASVLVAVCSRNQRTAILGLFALYGVITTVISQRELGGLPLGKQLETVAFVQAAAESGSVSQITHDMKPIDQVGLQYLLAQAQIPLQPTGAAIHIIFPTNNSQFLSKRLTASSGIWIDPRTQPNRRYITRDTFILQLPADWLAYESQNAEEKQDASTTFQIKTTKDETHWVHFYTKNNNPEPYAAQTQPVIESQVELPKQRPIIFSNEDGNTVYWDHWSEQLLVTTLPLGSGLEVLLP